MHVWVAGCCTGEEAYSLAMLLSNNDMSNLLAGRGIATLFLDHRLHVLRFTPAACAIVNLIPGDVGRSLSQVVSNLSDYSGLISDAQGVLDSLVPVEREVHTNWGDSFRMRIQPYGALGNVVEGAVGSFFNITEMVEVRDANDAVTMQDIDGQTLAWNPPAERLYGWTEAVALLARVKNGDVVPTYRSHRLTKSGLLCLVSVTATLLPGVALTTGAIVTTERLIEAGVSIGQ